MSTIVIDEIMGVRKLLGAPLNNAPSFKQIYDELDAEYQHITNETNNIGQAWNVNNLTLTTTPGERIYDIGDFLPDTGDFYKPLIVTTIPENDSANPEYVLEMVEKEHMPQEWAWLNNNNGQYLFSSHDSQMIAFYRGFENGNIFSRVEIRPTPNRAQDYNILYQVTDWWEDVATIGNNLPHSSQRFYIRALVARNLLLGGYVKWSFDDKRNEKRTVQTLEGVTQRLARYEPAYNQYIASLDNPDVTIQDSWADSVGYE